MNIKALSRIEPWQWPRNAAETIRGVLLNRQAKPSDRLIAADLAGDYTVISDEMDNALLKVLEDGSETDAIRVRAAISFGPVLETMYLELDDDEPPISESTLSRIHFTLEKVYQDTGNSKELRRRVVEGSVRFPQPWHEPAIREAWESGDPEWMLTAVFAMRHVRGFEESIMAALRSSDPLIHLEAVRAAGTWGLEAAWPHVVSLVQGRDTSKDLLIEAVSAVGSIRPAEARHVLEDLLDTGDEDVDEAAHEAIEMADATVRADSEADLDQEDGDEEDDEDEEDDKDWIN